jgi:hypothetical protein
MLLKIRQLVCFQWAGQEKKGTPKNGADVLQVVEDKYRKNVSFPPLHDVDENKLVRRISPRC